MSPRLPTEPPSGSIKPEPPPAPPGLRGIGPSWKDCPLCQGSGKVPKDDTACNDEYASLVWAIGRVANEAQRATVARARMLELVKGLREFLHAAGHRIGCPLRGQPLRGSADCSCRFSELSVRATRELQEAAADAEEDP